MSKDTLNPARICLSGMTALENRRAVPEKLNTFIYDATFTCAQSVIDGVGSFRHYIGPNTNKKKDDLYELRAKIVAFKSGRNINSEKFTDKQINLLGEIESMQPLSQIQEDGLDDTMRISGSGTVTSTETDTPSFLIYANQYVDGGFSTDDITVRGCLDNNPKWVEPLKRLPVPKSVVGFCGILQKFDTYTPPGKSAITCVVVAIKDIVYISKPLKKQDGKATEEPPPIEEKRNLRLRIKARGEAARSSFTETSQTSSSPSTSQKSLGKRKVQTSEEEINDDL
ncbi:hypothetical protein EDB84DRAFT_1614023 [Lactarius hengduanensis]|nr:hypothetical protein EDB84DRAFT_1614023 [Lactarius hengduanensis]